MTSWTFLFEVQWWHGDKFIQRFDAWSVDGKVLWDRAWPLFELQQAYKQLRRAEKTQPSGAEQMTHQDRNPRFSNGKAVFLYAIVGLVMWATMITIVLFATGVFK